MKKTVDADITLSGGEDGEPTQVVEVAKDPSRTHPLRQSDVIRVVNERLAGRKEINQHDVQCICKVYGVKRRSDFHYQGEVPGSPVQYSHGFVDWIVQQFERDPDFFGRCREKVRGARRGQYSLELGVRRSTPPLEAVCNAIALPWSNRPTEGYIDRLKTLKRRIYDRAGRAGRLAA